MKFATRLAGIGLATAIAAMLTGCGSGSSSEGAPSQSSMGTLSLSVSDSPIKDAAKVCIKFDGVELKVAGEGPAIDIDFDEPVVINLLANQGAVSETLISEEVEAGTYDWIRLKVDAETGNGAGANDSDPTNPDCTDEENGSYLLTDTGALYNIWVPSGDKTGLKLIKNITIVADNSSNYTAEWDLGKSFIAPPGLGAGEAIMKPVVKLVQNNEVGTLDGTVAAALLGPTVCDEQSEIAPSVYVYDDDGIPDNPVNGADGTFEAVATGLVAQEMQGMPYTYEIGFLLAGRYEVAFTCNGTNFIPGTGKFAEIFVGETTTVDFLAGDAPGGGGA